MSQTLELLKAADTAFRVGDEDLCGEKTKEAKEALEALSREELAKVLQEQDTDGTTLLILAAHMR